VELALTPERGASFKKVFPVASAWPVNEWPSDALVWGYYTLHLPPSFPSDAYTLTLALADPATETPQAQPIVLGQVTVDRAVCSFSVPLNAVSTNALFGNDLRLLGYQLRHDGDYLNLKLHWRAEQRMETDYKIFVHVFDPATAAPVAQDDSMPHRWAYPTTFWWPGELVADPIPIFLEGALEGVYGIAIGVYDPATMERLPVVDGTGQLQPDGRLVLAGETIQVNRSTQ
jgi:hypothetical protein